MKRSRVLVVEDEEFTRSLIVNALQGEGIDVVASTSSASYALKVAPRMDIDAALLDLNIGTGPTGLDLALGLRRLKPDIGIVFLTSYKDPRLLGGQQTMVPYGTVYMEKTGLSDLTKIRRSIEKSILNGQVGQNKNNVDLKTLPRLSNLSNSQVEIIRLVADGLSNSEIAKQRSVTEKSVEQTLSRIMKKLNMPMDERKNRRVEIAKYFRYQTGALASEEF
jgi:DNA-binding NarL/FixJ family response regulator